MDLSLLGWDASWAETYANQPDLDPAWLPARVVRQERGQPTVVSEDGPCLAAARGNLKRGKLVAAFPAIGDWVVLEKPQGSGAGRIHLVLPRRTQFSRKAAGHARREQVIAANIDTVFLVSGLDRNFNLRRIERYLAVAAASGAESVIVLNKSDLCPEASDRIEEVRSIAGSAPIVAISALDPAGLAPLQRWLRPGTTAALLGSSGVGKSTIVNCLLGDAIQHTQDARAGDDKGRHTTTSRELFRLPGGALLIDTPGVRELGMIDEEENLGESFDDVLNLAAACRFSNCRHQTEPGCAINEALAAGTLTRERLQSWQKLAGEQREAARHEVTHASRPNQFPKRRPR